MVFGIIQIVVQFLLQVINGYVYILWQISVGQNIFVLVVYGQNFLGSFGFFQQYNKGILNFGLIKLLVLRVLLVMGGQNFFWQYQGMLILSGQILGNSNVSFFIVVFSFYMQQQVYLKMFSLQFFQVVFNRFMVFMSLVVVVGFLLFLVSVQQRISVFVLVLFLMVFQQGLFGLSLVGFELGVFSQSFVLQMGSWVGLYCIQVYFVWIVGQELFFVYSGQLGGSGFFSVVGYIDLIDFLLKNRILEEWMNDLDDLLGFQ